MRRRNRHVVTIQIKRLIDRLIDWDTEHVLTEGGRGGEAGKSSP